MIFNETIRTKHRQTQSCFFEDLWEEDIKLEPSQENQKLNKRIRVRKLKIKIITYLRVLVEMW